MNTKKGVRVGILITSLLSSLAFSDFPQSSPPAMTGQAQTFDAAVTQNTQKGLQIFSGVNVASFLKGMDSDSDSGFSAGDSGGRCQAIPHGYGRSGQCLSG